MPLFPVSYPVDKPGAGEAATLAGHRLHSRDAVWVVGDDAPSDATTQADADACQAWLDGYDDVTVQREAAKRRVKDEAERRIVAVVPMWKQINATARGVELLNKVVTSGVLTSDEQAEAQAALNLFDAVVKPIRAASNEVEADIDGMPAAEAHEFDPATSSRWPA